MKRGAIGNGGVFSMFTKNFFTDFPPPSLWNVLNLTLPLKLEEWFLVASWPFFPCPLLLTHPNVTSSSTLPTLMDKFLGFHNILWIHKITVGTLCVVHSPLLQISKHFAYLIPSWSVFFCFWMSPRLDSDYLEMAPERLEHNKIKEKQFFSPECSDVLDFCLAADFSLS